MNQLVLSARIVALGALRHTPAGLAALDLTLAHESQAQEAGHERQAQVQIKAVAVGVIAERLRPMSLGSSARFSGFIAGMRRAQGIVLHIQAFDEVQAI